MYYNLVLGDVYTSGRRPICFAAATAAVVAVTMASSRLSFWFLAALSAHMMTSFHCSPQLNAMFTQCCPLAVACCRVWVDMVRQAEIPAAPTKFVV